MILTTKKLTKKYHNQVAVNELSFELNNQKCVALIGPNGSGKTTTLRMLAGLTKPTSGTIQLTNDETDFRLQIGYLPQHPVFHEWMTGEEYLIHVAKLSFMNKGQAVERASLLLKETGIFEAKDKRIAAYSGGMKQRLGIAQAMIHQPKLLLLDEPVSALDPVGRRDIITLIEQLKTNMTILFSTHILPDVDEICDELLLLSEGTLVEAGSLSLLRQKYESSKIELMFTEEEPHRREKLLQLDTVIDVVYSQNTYHLTVTPIEQAREDILKKVLDEGWALHSFHINRASLEDMFMKVVKS